MAVQATSSLVPDFTAAFFEECDLDMARDSLPAQLKLMEGLLKSDPGNRKILTALCMGFTGYAMLFVEDEDPERASRLYLRARIYGLRAIDLEGLPHEAIQDSLQRLGREETAPLFWTALSWNAWINLNLDKPEALGDLPVAEACLFRVMAMDPDYFFGSPSIITGAMLAARPRMLGGDAERANAFFSKAMRVSNGAFFLAPYYYARYYAVRVQDKALFLDLVKRIEQGRPDQLREVCLINTAIQQKTKALKKMSDELFF